MSKIILTLLLTTSVFADVKILKQAADYYQTRYHNPDLFQKITDNRGDGFEELYGTRNMRMVLKGILYRGGGNNYYHRTNPRNNMNPLPMDGMENICRDDFSAGVYLYTTRYSDNPKQYKCNTRGGWNNQMNYYNHPPLGSNSNIKAIMKLIYDQIKNFDGPIYVHCWNGWHASGLAAATSLRQFCDYTAEEAVAYWDKNTDGNNTLPSYEKVRVQIRNFVPFPEYKITEEEKEIICVR